MAIPTVMRNGRRQRAEPRLVQPLGPAIGAWFDRADVARLPDDALLATHLVVASDVVQEQIGRPGEEHPEHIVLRQHGGLMRAVQVGTADAGFVGACDRTLPVGRIAAALAQVLEVDDAALRSELLPQVRQLVADGHLAPAG